MPRIARLVQSGAMRERRYDEGFAAAGMDTDMNRRNFPQVNTAATAWENVGSAERAASVIAGSALALYGLRRGSVPGFTLAALGGCLVYRGATGHCSLYQSLGMSSSDGVDRVTAARFSGRRGVNVEHSVTVSRPVADVYRFWRQLENLPRFMEHLESVTVLDDRRSHWVAKAPGNTHVEWDAEIINEIDNELIAWVSLPGSDVASAGSVNFREAPDGRRRGTEVRVRLQYNPPGGKVGAAIASLFGEEPSQQIAEDMARLKQLLETSEAAASNGGVRV